MSSSGKGQSVARTAEELGAAFDYAVANMRGDRPRVIVEQFIDFDYEITLLTVATKDGVLFCPPIGHRQEGGDYRESWQPAAMDAGVLARRRSQAAKVVGALGGHGLFGVEFFIAGDQAIFSELSPRPHDTGMVTLIGQSPNEFELHLRAILGLPIPAIRARRSSRIGGDPRRPGERDVRLRRALPKRSPSARRTSRSTCACSPSPRPCPDGGWALRWRLGRESRRRGSAPSPSRPGSRSHIRFDDIA